MEASGYSFEDLEVYKIARVFRNKIYQLIRLLPEVEKFNLQSQMRRAALSVTNNIAEGHGRYHYQETIQFLRQARGSLDELIDDLNLCIDQRYSREDKLGNLKNEAYEVLKKLKGGSKNSVTRERKSRT